MKAFLACASLAACVTWASASDAATLYTFSGTVNYNAFSLVGSDPSLAAEAGLSNSSVVEFSMTFAETPTTAVIQSAGNHVSQWNAVDYSVKLNGVELISDELGDQAFLIMNQQANYEQFNLTATREADLYSTAGIERLTFTYNFVGAPGTFAKPFELPTDDSFRATPAVGITFSNQFRVVSADSTTGGAARISNGRPGALSVTVTNTPPPGGPSAAPEPSAWALMIGGFGLAGAALRRNGRRVAV